METEQKLSELVILAQQKIVDNQFITFEISDNVKIEIQRELGLDCSEYCFQIDVYAIKHIFKEHGNVAKETQRGQIPITENDILLIIEVLKTPDIILSSGKSKLGKDTLTFIKEIEGRYVVIQEVRTGKKMIALSSMRILKTKRTKFT